MMKYLEVHIIYKIICFLPYHPQSTYYMALLCIQPTPLHFQQARKKQEEKEQAERERREREERERDIERLQLERDSDGHVREKQNAFAESYESRRVSYNKVDTGVQTNGWKKNYSVGVQTDEADFFHVSLIN